MNARIAALIAGALVLVLDVVTKQWVTDTYPLYSTRELLGDGLRLTHIHNAGAAFGLFQGSRWPLVSISVIAVLAVSYLLFTRARRHRVALPLGLILGGALGNLIDRIRLGRVVDFLDIGYGDWRWPVFNVADAAVTVAVIWLAVVLVFGEGKKRGDLESSGDGRGGGDAAGSPPAATPS